MATYYEILGVSPTASYEDIKKSYHALALEHHPDKNTPGKDPYLYADIDRAWNVLRDTSLRKKYDAEIKASESEAAHPVQEEVHLSEMRYHCGFKRFEKPCRCGGLFHMPVKNVIGEMDSMRLDSMSLLVYCDECSLSIVVNCDVQYFINLDKTGGFGPPINPSLRPQPPKHSNINF